jgi:hypothetical protein
MGARASRVVVCLLLCATWLGGVPGRVWAQAGWYVTPSFGLMEEYDDNVFVSSSDRRSDFITRFTPGLEAGYVSEPLTALVRGAFDSEVYADHSELNDAFASYRTGLTLGYLPLRTLSFGLDATYAETNDVTELLVATTGFQEERRNATELVVAPSAAWNITARDVARGSYSFTRDTADESPDILAHRGRLTLSRDVTTLDTGLVGYIVRVFENEDGPTTTSHVPLLGWRRQFTRQTSATVEGGPRFTDGGVQPEVSARLEHDFRRARITLAYERTEAVIIGGSGVVEVERILGAVDFEPIRGLKIGIAPSYTRTFEGVDPTARIYALAVTARYPLTRWLAARADGLFVFQEQGGVDLHRNIVSVGLDLVYPIRLSD